LKIVMVNPRPYRWLTVSNWTVVAVSSAIFVVIALLPYSWTTNNLATPQAYDLDTVTVVRPECKRYLVYTATACIVILLVYGILGLYRRTQRLATLSFLTAFASPVSCVVAFVRDPAPWQIHSEIRDADGETYCFAESSFLQGQRLMLGRLHSETQWTRTFQVLVEATGDSPRKYLRIVRPAGVVEEYAQVYRTNSGWLLGLRHDNNCFFAYDLNAGKSYSSSELEELSPFLALDGTTELHEPDVADVKSKMGTKFVGVPTDESLRKSLDHPNPRVQALAAQLLEPKR